MPPKPQEPNLSAYIYHILIHKCFHSMQRSVWVLHNVRSSLCVYLCMILFYFFLPHWTLSPSVHGIGHWTSWWRRGLTPGMDEERDSCLFTCIMVSDVSAESFSLSSENSLTVSCSGAFTHIAWSSSSSKKEVFPQLYCT